jgi:hypothetical protein
MRHYRELRMMLQNLAKGNFYLSQHKEAPKKLFEATYKDTEIVINPYVSERQGKAFGMIHFRRLMKIP